MIGIFDSGLGGLTALREAVRLLPGRDIVYFGDTGRIPYGTRSRETIIRYARAMKESMDSNIETLYHMFDHRAEAVEAVSGRHRTKRSRAIHLRNLQKPMT